MRTTEMKVFFTVVVFTISLTRSSMAMGKPPVVIAPDYPGKTFVTSTGAVMTRVQSTSMGDSWMDPSGTVWHYVNGDYSNDGSFDHDGNFVTDSPAVQACKNAGGSLPLNTDFGRLEQYFGFVEINAPSANFISDIEKIFPEMAAGPVWTQSLSDPTSALAFFPEHVGTSDNDYESTLYSVRLSESHKIYCVSQSPASYTSSIGAVFTLVRQAQFFPAWQAPDQTVWSTNLDGTAYLAITQDMNGQPVFTSPAKDKCQKLGAHLPNADELSHFSSYFVQDQNGFLAQGLEDYQAVSAGLYGNTTDLWIDDPQNDGAINDTTAFSEVAIFYAKTGLILRNYWPEAGSPETVAQLGVRCVQ